MIFRFKKFAVSHANSSMKVGTDAVLLGAWADVKHSKNILDIGTGSGIIAMIMAQKNTEAIIKAIDIDENSICEATQNFEQCQWKQRLEARLIALQDYPNSIDIKFDHIISNPPFFSNSTPAPNKSRHQARHTDTLSLDDFFKSCKNLLTNEGKISLIVPFDSSLKWIEAAEKYLFFPSRITNVIPYPSKPMERILVEFTSSQKAVESNEILIRQGKGLGYSEDYIKLTKEFYL